MTACCWAAVSWAGGGGGRLGREDGFLAGPLASGTTA